MLHYLSPKCLVSALFDLKVNQNKVEDSIRKPKAAYQRGTDNAMTDRKKKTQTMVSKILYRKQLTIVCVFAQIVVFCKVFC
jgi:hypothetical protein